MRDGVGHVGSEVVSKAEAMCACAPEAMKLVSDGLFEAVKKGADLSGAVLEFIGSLIKVQKVRFEYSQYVSWLMSVKCFIDHGFNIQESKIELQTTGDLSNTNGWSVIEAAEVCELPLTVRLPS